MKFVVIPHLYIVLFPFQKNSFCHLFFTLIFHSEPIICILRLRELGFREDAQSHTANMCQGLTPGLVPILCDTVLAIPSAPEMPGLLPLCGQQRSPDVCIWTKGHFLRMTS